jgi:hypothetical protein
MGIPCGTGEPECAIESLLGLTDQSSASPQIRRAIRSGGLRSSISDFLSEGKRATAFFILPPPTSCQLWEFLLAGGQVDRIHYRA